MRGQQLPIGDMPFTNTFCPYTTEFSGNVGLLEQFKILINSSQYFLSFFIL